MAYMNQEKKAKIAAAIKPILKKYGLKGSLSVRSHMTAVLTIKAGKIDFIGNYLKVNSNKINEEWAKCRAIDVNPYWYQDHFDGIAKAALAEIIPAMYSADWYDRSDAMVDYFDTAYYIDVNIGKWNKPYQLEA